MRRLRVGIVCRRFWPLSGGAERAIADLALGLAWAGVLPQIITTKPAASSWPSEISYCGIPVVRLPRSQTPGIGPMRHLFGLYRWLRSNRQNLDAVIVSELKAESYIAIAALQGTKVPVIVRVERAGIGGDLDRLQANPLGSRILQQAFQAAAWVTSSQAATQESIAAGVPSGRITRISSPTPPSMPVGPIERQDARNAFAAINFDLGLPENSLLVAAHGRLITTEGFADLIAAWSHVLQKFPTARLWIGGEGPERGRLFNQVKDLGLGYLATMPGAMDDISGLIAAADGWVIPSWGESAPGLVPAVVSRQLPLVITDTPAHRERVPSHAEARWFSTRQRHSLANALCQMLGRQIPPPGVAPPAIDNGNLTATQAAQAYYDLLEQVLS